MTRALLGRLRPSHERIRVTAWHWRLGGEAYLHMTVLSWFSAADGTLTDNFKTAQEEIRWAKKEVQTEKLKGVATTASTNMEESVGPFFGSNKVRTLEKENIALQREVAAREEISNVRFYGLWLLNKTLKWFLQIKDMIHFERLCITVGSNKKADCDFAYRGLLSIAVNYIRKNINGNSWQKVSKSYSLIMVSLFLRLTCAPLENGLKTVWEVKARSQCPAKSMIYGALWMLHHIYFVLL